MSDSVGVKKEDGIVHIVLLKFPEGTPADTLKPLCTAFYTLKDTCIHPDTQKPYILSIKGGYDNSEEGLQHGHTYGFIVEFANKYDRDIYVNKDGAHDVFKKALGSVNASATVIDFTPGVF
ncbi:hypothetical protein ABW20_dc0107561 [Dactylellina cionopaga]|nr:hypothetical protein ABW20_dc0107561 [Dactylellina cionopaga]